MGKVVRALFVSLYTASSCSLARAATHAWVPVAALEGEQHTGV